MDLKYLRLANRGINHLWDINFRKISKVRLVIIGEAPLWGKNEENYIYNPNTNNSQFFYRGDIDKIIGYEPNNKTEFLNILAKLGILIIDVSPYALNGIDTQLTYQHLRNLNYVQMIYNSMNQFKLTRKELHELVWAETLTALLDYPSRCRRIPGSHR